MKHGPYDPDDARAILPLLGSIGRELTERTTKLDRLEERIERLSELSPTDDSGYSQLIAEAAVHRHALRACRSELERLGCSLIATTPLTIRIPTRQGETRKSLVWQRDSGTDS